MDVFADKTSENLPEDADNEAMREGRDLEDYVAGRFSEAAGLKVRRANVMYASAWYIAVLIYGREFKYVRIERDEEVIRNLVRIEQDFWENHVLKNVMPEPDGTEATDQFINSYFAQSRELLSKPLIGFDEKLSRREEIAGLMEKLTQEKRKIEQEVKAYLDEAEIAENENFFVSWKNSVSKRIDLARLKAERPEVYEEFTRSVQSRRLLIRAV